MARMTFEQYLLEVGIRKQEFDYAPETLLTNVAYFKRCYKQELSPYKALLYLEFQPMTKTINFPKSWDID